MRRFVGIAWVVFAISVFGLSVVAQRRSRGRGGAPRQAAVPASPRIAQELGGVAWGWSHDQVIDFYRRAIIARYQPLLRNRGQVEQDRMMSERDAEVQRMRDSYVNFDGTPRRRLWDTSFVGPEYTHNNNESMLVRQEPNGTREYYFFFNDHLWKRFQARVIPSGPNRPEFSTFAQTLEQVFGQGLHMNRAGGQELETVVWQDDTTRLHLVNNITFFNAVCLVYEERATIARLAELRRNAPTKVAAASERARNDDIVVGNVESDPNADIVDRITGKIRRVDPGPQAGRTPGSPGSPGSAPPGGATSGAGAVTGTRPTPPPDDDPLRGL